MVYSQLTAKMGRNLTQNKIFNRIFADTVGCLSENLIELVNTALKLYLSLE